MEAIKTANDPKGSSESIVIPDQQLQTMKDMSTEALFNICDQIVERSSKYLTQR